MSSKNVAAKPKARLTRGARTKTLKPAGTRRHAPKAHRAHDQKVKLSIALSKRDLAWVGEVAEKRGLSVSGLMQEALQFYKRDQDLGALLELVGGTEDISQEDVEAVCAEWRSAGLQL
jgi:hypothetical protein